jgi:hypothetical protein
MEHLVRPGDTPEANPHHFAVIRVDGDLLSVEVIATGDVPFAPYSGGRAKIALSDSGS